MFKTIDLVSVVKKLNNTYNEDWLEWLPETLRMTIKHRWGAIDRIDMDRLLAARNLILYKYFWHDVDIFEATVNAFNWVDIDHRLGIRPSPAQIVYAIKLANDIVDSKKLRFREDVIQYIASIFINGYYVYVPDEFRINKVQKYLDKYYQDPELVKAVKMKWEIRLKDDTVLLEETTVDVQVAKLLAIKKYTEIGGIASPSGKRDILTRLILE